MADAIEKLNSVRTLAVDQARSNLAVTLDIENAARKQADESDAQIGHEVEAASSLSAGDHAVEAFAGWLPIGRARAADARTRHERSLVDVACARAGLNAALIAAEISQKYLTSREEERRHLQDKRRQQTDDEFASRVALQKHDR